MRAYKKNCVVDVFHLTEKFPNTRPAPLWFAASPESDIQLVDFGAQSTDVASVKTPNGYVTAAIGDCIIRNAKGEFFVCSAVNFEQCYSVCEEESGDI